MSKTNAHKKSILTEMPPALYLGLIAAFLLILGIGLHFVLSTVGDGMPPGLAVLFGVLIISLVVGAVCTQVAWVRNRVLREHPVRQVLRGRKASAESGLGTFLLGACIYFQLCSPVLWIATMRFPWYRRWMRLFRPHRLPRLKGLTLIELLIAVALVALFVTGLASVSGNVHQAYERQRTRREAVALIEDQVALLRAAPGLPADGEHPFDAALAENAPLAQTARYEIAPGPYASLRTVRLRVPLSGQARESVEMAVLLPVGEAKEAGS